MNNTNIAADSRIPDVNNDSMETSMSIEAWLQFRKDEGLRIDPETAEVFWSYEYTADPYGAYPDIQEEFPQVGREYFARAPGSEIWIWFGDLPDAVYKKLWEKHKAKLAFPAGLFDWQQI